MLSSILRRLRGQAIAICALCVALGGTSYAAITISGKNVKNGSLTGADLKNGSVTGADVQNGSLTKSDLKKGTIPTGGALAYAHVVNGVLDPANSKNVKVTKVATSTCLQVTTAQAPKNVVAMIDNSGANPQITSVAGTVEPSAVSPNCPAGSNALITTVESGTFTPKPFYVTFN
jgi:hypothetical protein